jgi:Putative Tad-like Flp pilus-assembly
MRRFHHKSRSRRGAALILAVVLLFALFSVLAFTIDTGYLAQSRAECVRCADSAALAGCWDVYTQLNGDIDPDASVLRPGVVSSASQFANLNNVCTASPALSASDIQVGYTSELRGGSVSNDASLPFYAVRVKVKKTAEQNGQVPFFFGRIFGNSGQDMTSESTAVMARKISGFQTPSGSDTLDILPFALDEQTWNGMIALASVGAAPLGTDQYSYNASTGSVSSGSDGILEVNLYPQGTGSPGNRGTVDIGGSNNSTNDIKRQILSGISASDLAALGKPLELDSTGNLQLNGDTGISAGVKDPLAQIIGKKRIIPIFRSVTGNGNNANYTIVKFVGIRVLHVNLTGSMSSKKLIVQPAPIIAKYGIRSTSVSSSDFVLTPVLLAE